MNQDYNKVKGLVKLTTQQHCQLVMIENVQGYMATPL